MNLSPTAIEFVGALRAVLVSAVALIDEQMAGPTVAYEDTHEHTADGINDLGGWDWREHSHADDGTALNADGSWFEPAHIHPDPGEG